MFKIKIINTKTKKYILFSNNLLNNPQNNQIIKFLYKNRHLNKYLINS